MYIWLSNVTKWEKGRVSSKLRLVNCDWIFVLALCGLWTWRLVGGSSGQENGNGWGDVEFIWLTWWYVVTICGVYEKCTSHLLDVWIQRYTHVHVYTTNPHAHSLKYNHKLL